MSLGNIYDERGVFSYSIGGSMDDLTLKCSLLKANKGFERDKHL